ncbi:hypothetical protein ACH4NF_27290 [Streptomyces sp. NPDC017248]
MTALRGEEPGAELVARSVAAYSDEVAELDARIETRFRQHRDAKVILSMHGMGSHRRRVYRRDRRWRPHRTRQS